MAARSSISSTDLTRSGSYRNALRNITLLIRTKTAISTITIGVMWSRKSLKERPAREPMMMLGGSPISVAAPPMLHAITSAIRYGTTGRPSLLQTRMVTGAISRTVVTLSSQGDSTAVARISRTISR